MTQLFSINLTSFQRFWFLSLLVMWAMLLFGGFLVGPTRDQRRIARPARLGSSFLLVVAGWSWVWVTAGSVYAPYALFMAVGITFGLLGDLFFADVLLRSRSKSVMAGMAAFAVGHLFYIAGMAWLVNHWQLDAAMLRWGALLVAWLLGVVGWYGMVRRGREQVSLVHYVALPYALLLATTVGMAVGIALQVSGFWLLAAGALLFFLSDLILAGALFNDLQFPLLHDVVWLMYGPGQFLLVFSVALVS